MKFKIRKVEAGHYRLAKPGVEQEAIVARQIGGSQWFAWCPSWTKDQLFKTKREAVQAILTEWRNG